LALHDGAGAGLEPAGEEVGEGGIGLERELRLLHRHVVLLAEGADGELVGGLPPLQPRDAADQARKRVLRQEAEEGDQGGIHHGPPSTRNRPVLHSSRWPTCAPSQASPSASFQCDGTGSFQVKSARISAPVTEREITVAFISIVWARWGT